MRHPFVITNARSKTRLLYAKLVLILCGAVALPLFAEEPAPGKVLKALFLGDAKSHHNPAKFYNALHEPMAKVGIDIAFTEKNSDLNSENLAKYDCLIMYSNSLACEPGEEKALLDFVDSGKGFVPIHCASACFKNSPKFIALVGGEFKSHKTGVFDVNLAAADHPIMKGYVPFQTWDETYVHAKHNTVDRIVLQTRTEGTREEPWTWVRTQGKGRVFYTAYGHDQRTWENPGFMELIERGVKWSAGDDKVNEHVKPYPRAARKEPSPTAPAPANEELQGIELPKPQPARTDVKPFEYENAEVPFYAPPGRRGSAEGWNKMQKPLDPAESQKHLILPEGFEAQLFVSDPQIHKPITMAWDYKGRLWIAETVDYPNNKQPSGEGHDQITICEDTNGDGRADKFTVFADKLSIPTSITFANGGVIIQQAPETLFLKSTKGDDHCDERKVLMRGWGVGDTHAGPSNLRYGFDNQIWGIVGYSAFNGTVHGESLRFSQGFYRFMPDASKLEFLRSNNNNSWGLGFSEEGIVFGSTANGNSNVYLPIPNRYYESVRGWSPGGPLRTIADSIEMHPATDKVRQVDWHGKFTAGAGSALYTARNYPKAYWNRTTFVNEPTGHLTSTFVLERDGANFIARNTADNLVSSDDEWTAPIMAEVGPDGNIWVIDWYNYIVQHNPTPKGWKTGKGSAYETPLRDKLHGRIYRIVYKGAKENPQPKLDPKDPATMLAALKNDNMFWRTTAQRLLVERGNADIVPELIKLTQDKTLDGIGLTPCAIHAVWTMHGLGQLDGKNSEATAATIAALKHPSAGVRRNAVQVLPRNEAGVRALLDAGLTTDKDAQVRLAAFLTLAEMPHLPAAAQALAAALNDSANMSDAILPDAITSASAAQDLEFLKEAAKPGSKFVSQDRALKILMQVADHYARGKPAESIGGIVVALADAEPKVQDAVLAGMAKGWPKDAKANLDEPTEQALAKLMLKSSPGSNGYLTTLASRWGSSQLEKYSAEITKKLLDKVSAENATDTDRTTAAVQLMGLRKNDPETVRTLLALVTPRRSSDFNAVMIEAVRLSEASETAAILVDALKSLPPMAKPLAQAALLERIEWTLAFIKAAEAGKVDLSELSLDQKQTLATHPVTRISESAQKLLKAGGGIPDADRQKVIDEISPLVLKKGDPVKGKELFKTNCMKCHTHSGEGGHVGPELTGMAVHPKGELLIAILDPSRDVEDNFKQYLVATNDGLRVAGLLASSTKTSVEILDAEAKSHQIQNEDIKMMEKSKKSLMPEGFETVLKPEGLADVLEFMTQKGKYVPLDLRKVASAVSTKGMFISKDADEQRLIFPDWKPKTFQGVTFSLVDPQGDRVPNAVVLYSTRSAMMRSMPKSVTLPCNTSAKAIHFLSGVSGWGAMTPKQNGGVCMTVRLVYEDSKTEEFPLVDGVHFADYIGLHDVPESKLAFRLRSQQLRYFSIAPKRTDAVIKQIELVKGPDNSSPVVMAITVEP